MFLHSSFIFILSLINLNVLRIDGEASFEKLRSMKYFIDKSEIIATFFNDEILPYHYITYPNGFGKSINLQMLKLFANIVVDQHGHPIPYQYTHTYHLFQGLKIFKHHEIVKKHIAQHAVLHLSFVKLHNVTEEFILGYLNDRLRTCFEDYEWLMSIPKEELMNKKNHKFLIGPEEISFLEKLYWQRLTIAEAVKGLRTLSKILSVYFGKKVVILIDQYDKVVSTTSVKWDETTKYVYNKINAMIAHALESHQFVQRALIFGTNTVLPFRETHVILNRIRHYPFLSEHIFDSFFGFSAYEMKKLYSTFKCSPDEIHGIREYYNGYKILDSHESLFNPRSVMQYLDNKHANKTAFRRYWKEEERFLEIILKHESIQKILVNLVQDMPVSFNMTNIYSELDYRRYREDRYDDLILTLLFDRGYLTPTKDDDHFILPNVEIKLDIENELKHLGFTFDSKWTRTRPQYGTWTSPAEQSGNAESLLDNSTKPFNNV